MGGRVIPEGLVELVVVIFVFAEVVNHVAEVEEESRDVSGIGLAEVLDHLVGDHRHIGRAFRRTRIPHGVKYDLASRLNGFGLSRPCVS